MSLQLANSKANKQAMDFLLYRHLFTYLCLRLPSRCLVEPVDTIVCRCYNQHCSYIHLAMVVEQKTRRSLIRKRQLLLTNFLSLHFQMLSDYFRLGTLIEQWQLLDMRIFYRNLYIPIRFDYSYFPLFFNCFFKFFYPSTRPVVLRGRVVGWCLFINL